MQSVTTYFNCTEVILKETTISTEETGTFCCLTITVVNKDGDESQVKFFSEGDTPITVTFRDA